MKMSKETGKALKELSVAIKTMVPPSGGEAHIGKAKTAAMKLRSMLKSERGLWEGTNLVEAIPAVTVASLLVDVVSCTQQLAESIQELSSLAEFKNKDHKVAPHNQTSSTPLETLQSCDSDNSGPHHVITINHTATATQ